MNTVSDRIRAAAQRSEPDIPMSLTQWVGDGLDWSAVAHFLVGGMPDWWNMNNGERRMFLVFVAEALES